MKQEYTVVTDPYLPSFIDEINKRLNEGWRLHGEMNVVSKEGFTPNFYQAMVREVVDMEGHTP